MVEPTRKSQSPLSVIRPGGDLVLPRTTVENGEVVYEDGLSEGNLYAILFAVQELTNTEMRTQFGEQVAQLLIDRGYGLDQLPPPSTTPEGQRVRVQHALARGLVRDRFGRPMVD